MGATQSSIGLLTPDEISELKIISGNVFNDREIIHLYKRFTTLDKDSMNLITRDTLMKIPELAYNPLAPRIIDTLDPYNTGISMDIFVQTLAVMSPKASSAAKIQFIFDVFDSDGDDLIKISDFNEILKLLLGKKISEEKISEISEKSMKKISEKNEINLKDFKNFLIENDFDPFNFKIEF